MTIERYLALKKAVAEWLREEFTAHLDKDGNLRDIFAHDETHGNPDDCLQCRVEMELL